MFSLFLYQFPFNFIFLIIKTTSTVTSFTLQYFIFKLIPDSIWYDSRAEGRFLLQRCFNNWSTSPCQNQFKTLPKRNSAPPPHPRNIPPPFLCLYPITYLHISPTFSLAFSNSVLTVTLPALLHISNKKWFVLVCSPAPTICPVCSSRTAFFETAGELHVNSPVLI